MARECRRKRDERRFGKPERLADIVDFDGWSGVPIEATNVHQYYRQFMKDRGSLSLADDIHCARLPHPSVFIEMACVDLAGIRVGWSFDEIDPKGDLAIGAAPVTGMMAPEYATNGRLFLEIHRSKAWWAECVCHMDHMGRLLANPAIRFNPSLERFASLLISGGTPIDFAMETLVPCLLALSFMNCKNVTTEAVAPDPAINRERKKAGLKPFVRFHTININPMKAVLRTEGDIEHNGLKKALHICRGHFARYTEDRPLFGHFVGTVWKPSHVRGSAQEGVVVSDYRVNSPGGAAP